MMSLMRWDPFRELEEMSERLNRLIRKPFGRLEGQEEALTVADWVPVVDIEESEKEYLVKAELPGVDRADVKVEIEDGVLSIQGERRQEKEEKGRKFHRIERSYGKFVRSFTMPADVDEKKVLANFKEGVLYVHVPKTEAAKPKAVEVKVA